MVKWAYFQKKWSIPLIFFKIFHYGKDVKCDLNGQNTPHVSIHHWLLSCILFLILLTTIFIPHCLCVSSQEANAINKSLSALGDVISALSLEQPHVPYRNNKLTQLMQDSLGGNAKTLMFLNIAPSDCNLDETLTSLMWDPNTLHVSYTHLN